MENKNTKLNPNTNYQIQNRPPLHQQSKPGASKFEVTVRKPEGSTPLEQAQAKAEVSEPVKKAPEVRLYVQSLDDIPADVDPSVTTVSFCLRSIDDRALANLLSKLPNIKSLSIDSPYITLNRFNLPTSLENLSISGQGQRVRIDNGRLSEAMSQCRNLRTLSLFSSDITGLRVPVSLETLSIDSSNSSRLSSIIKNIEQCTCLKCLSIGFSQVSLSGSTLPPSLNELRMGQNKIVDNKSLKEAIAKCTNLQILDISGSRVSLEGITLPSSLKQLIFEGNKYVTSQNLFASLRNVANIGNLDVGAYPDEKIKKMMNEVKNLRKQYNLLKGTQLSYKNRAKPTDEVAQQLASLPPELVREITEEMVNDDKPKG